MLRPSFETTQSIISTGFPPKHINRGRRLECVEIIGIDGSFTKELTTRIERWGRKSEFKILTIIRPVMPQLLDQLFGTDFCEDSLITSARNVRLYGANDTDLLIMNVNVPISLRFDESDEVFIRNTLYLSLALSDVVVISLRDSFSGGQPLHMDHYLRTIFGTTLSLFGKDADVTRILLVFLIPPDYRSGTSLLQTSIAAKSKRLWQSLRREYGIRDCHYHDFFDFVFAKVTHGSRVSDTAQLRLRFMDETKEDYLFKPEYSKRVPARKLAQYMEGIWEFLHQEKHSHPPTRRQLLSAFGSIARPEGPPTPRESYEVLLSIIQGDLPPQHDMIGAADVKFSQFNKDFVAQGGSSAQEEMPTQRNRSERTPDPATRETYRTRLKLITREGQEVHDRQRVRNILASQSQLDGTPLHSLLAIFRKKQSKTPIRSLVDAITAGLVHDLLRMENYVSVASEELAIASDVEVGMLLDFILYLLENDYFSSLSTDVLDYRNRARRLMFKIVSEKPAMPKSLIISGVKLGSSHNGTFSGGFADVLKGELQGRPVALKLLRNTRHNNIYREALTWRLLRHDYVLPFLGVHLEQSMLYLVSPFMDNGTLAGWRSSLNPSVAESVAEIQTHMLQVAQGLQYIHSQGIVHADIRGTNILLDFNFCPKIADFGLARHSEATGAHSDSLSPHFMAPELFGSWEDSDDSDDTQKIERTPHSDVYAFGCLYYEIHFNVIPFRETSYVRMVKQVTQKHRPKRLPKPALNIDAWKLISRCWEHEPSKRPTMEGVVKKMKRWSRCRGLLIRCPRSRNSGRTFLDRSPVSP